MSSAEKMVGEMLGNAVAGSFERHLRLAQSAPELLQSLRNAIAIIQDLYAWEPIEAQHEETGVTWRGERRAMPNRYYEVGNQAGVPPDEMAKKLEAMFDVIHKATGA